jgi:hypothetical protein
MREARRLRDACRALRTRQSSEDLLQGRAQQHKAFVHRRTATYKALLVHRVRGWPAGLHASAGRCLHHAYRRLRAALRTCDEHTHAQIAHRVLR